MMGVAEVDAARDDGLGTKESGRGLVPGDGVGLLP